MGHIEDGVEAVMVEGRTTEEKQTVFKSSDGEMKREKAVKDI